MVLVAMVMLLVGGEDALSGLQNLTILVAAPFVVIMVVLCVALMRDLHHDAVVLREQKGTEVIEQAIDYGTDKHGDDFYLRVQSFPADADGPWRTGDTADRVTYAEIRRGADPFRDEVVEQQADTDADVLHTGPASAGRPSAERE